MGYGNLDLDEIPTDILEQELRRRKTLISEGKCPYCGGALESHTCKYSDLVSPGQASVFGRTYGRLPR